MGTTGRKLGMILLLTGAFTLIFLSGIASAQSREPIKIGCLTAHSGQMADWGELERCGYALGLEDYGAEVLGRPVTLIHADTEMNPDVAGRRARRLVEVDGCKILIGGATTSETLSIASVAKEKKVLYLAVESNGDQITSTHASHYHFLIGPPFKMALRGIAPYVAQHLGKNWYFVTADYTAGHAATQFAREVLKTVGGKEIGELKVPLGTRDFSAQLLKIRNSGADVLVCSLWGFDSVALLRQLAEFKIYDKMKVWYTSTNYVDFYPLEPGQRKAYAGTECHYKENEEMKAFSERFHKKFPRAAIPILDVDTYNAWLAIRILFEGIKKAGTADDVEKMICAIEGLTITDNKRSAPSYVRPWDHQVITQMCFAKCNPVSGSDFWELITCVPLKDYAPPQEEQKLDVSCNPNPKYAK